jgi:glutathione peroxidase
MVYMSEIYSVPVQNIQGETTTLETYRGQVLVIVNVASQCGYTPQYKGLEALYTRFKDQGFVVLGFPCNQFGKQEPGTNAEIQTFCEASFGATFPMFAKIRVNGDDAHPLFDILKDEARGVLGSRSIKWNFTKFLVGRDGVVKKRYGSTSTPNSMTAEIETLLGESVTGAANT